MNFDEFVQLPIQDITYFTHIKKPSGLPIPAIQALTDMFDTFKVDFDPVVKESIELLETNQKQLIENFMKQEQFELPISIDLIQVINLVLKGIHQESIAVEDLMKVFGDGNPITIEEAKRNFEKLLRETVGNNDENRVRLTVKK